MDFDGLDEEKYALSHCEIGDLIFSKIRIENGSQFSLLKLNPIDSVKNSILFDEISFMENSKIFLYDIDKEFDISIQGNFFWGPHHENILIKNCDLSKLTINVDNLNNIQIDSNNIPHNVSSWNYSINTLFNNAFDTSYFEDKATFIESRISTFNHHKHLAKEAGNKRLEDDYLYCQLFWENQRKWNVFNWLYLAACGYGKSVAQPLMIFVAMIFLFGCIYGLILSFAPVNANELSPSLLAIEASIPSFENPFEPEAFKSPYAELMLVLVYVQKAVQFFLLVEAGMAIRNAVKK